MNRAVNIETLNSWIEEHGPLGLEKLAVKSGISSSLIEKARRGLPPRKLGTMKAIADAMTEDVDDLFPLLAPTGEGDIAS